MDRLERSARSNSAMGKINVVLLLTMFVVPVLAGVARADTTEIRDYAIIVDGKQSGYSQCIITAKKDGTTFITSRANAKVKIFLATFTFSYQGTEVWKNYRLLRVDGVGRQNRKQYNVSAVLDNNNQALRVSVNNQERLIPADSWSSSFWKLPQIKERIQKVSVLKSSHGTLIDGQLHYLETVKQPINGQQKTCYHFRLTGGKKPIDFWFDAQHRLVRQEFVEMGHRTIVEMVNIRRMVQQPAQASAQRRR